MEESKKITIEEATRIRRERNKRNAEIAYKVYDLIKDMEYKDVSKLIEFIEWNFKKQKDKLNLSIDYSLKTRTDNWF